MLDTGLSMSEIYVIIYLGDEMKICDLRLVTCSYKFNDKSPKARNTELGY